MFVGEVAERVMPLVELATLLQTGISVVFSGSRLLSIIFRCNCLKWHPQPGR